MFPRALLTLFLVTCGACGRRADSEPQSIHRDSSGIMIVENHRAAWTPDNAWRLASGPSVVISDATHNFEQAPLDPVSAWSTSDGKIVVADGDQSGWHAFLVYTSTGEFLRKVGRDGEGPGEFGQLFFAFPYRADSLLGFDTTDQSLAVFSVDGGFSREVRVPQLRPPGDRVRGTYGLMVNLLGSFVDGTILFTSQGRLAVDDPGFAWYERELVRLGPDGTVRDSLGVEQAYQQWWTGTNSRMAPFAAMTHHTVSESSYFKATGETFEVREYGLDGSLRRVIRRPFGAEAVTERDKERMRTWYWSLLGAEPGGHAPRVDRITEDMREWGYADQKPALSKLLVDNRGFIWVEHFRWVAPDALPPDPTPTRWSVFASDGIWLGEVEVPERVLVQHVQGTRVVGVHMDINDVQSIYVYELLGRDEPAA